MVDSVDPRADPINRNIVRELGCRIKHMHLVDHAQVLTLPPPASHLS